MPDNPIIDVMEVTTPGCSTPLKVYTWEDGSFVFYSSRGELTSLTPGWPGFNAFVDLLSTLQDMRDQQK